MIVSDRIFLEKVQEKNIPIAPENELGFIKAAKLEKVFSTVGGAIITYAAAKSFTNKEEKSWLDYTLAIIGGAILLRGALKTKIDNGLKEDSFPKNTR
ncbi:MAG: hypothetical protein M3512_04500 [Bacteroidota bacterium]|nr:hypothetical protein [Bacteroidota bacterium]